MKIKKKKLKKMLKRWERDLAFLEPAGWYAGNTTTYYRLKTCIKDVEKTTGL